MSEFPAVSPLLDGFTVGACISNNAGVSCYQLRHDDSGQEFILKHISIPQSEEKVQALLLSGAYADTQEANAYFKQVADRFAEEVTLSKQFAECPYILQFLAYQLDAKENGIGYDLYAVTDKSVSLQAYTAANAMTKLQAINLGIDLCAALSTIRASGYLHQNIKPENVYVEKDRFMLGDFGLTALQDMQYSALPEEYVSPYTAPELHELMAGQNTTTDIYAVGILLHRIYNANHAPFEDERISSKEAEHMRLSGKELPPPMYADYELAEIILKACAFKSENRYQTPEEFKQALELYMQRNGIDDTLIVPPIISDAEPELANIEPEEEETDPVRFADVSAMDEDFIKYFTPDTEALNAAIEQMKQEDAKQAAKTEAQQKQAKEQVPQEAPEEAEDEAAAAAQVEAVQPEAEKAQPEKLIIKGLANDAAKEQKEAPAEDAEHTLIEESKELIATAESLPEGKPFSAPAAEFELIEDDPAHKQPTHRHGRHKSESKTKKSKKHGKKHNTEGKKRKTLRTVLGALLVVLVACIFVYFFTPFGQRLYHYTINIEQFRAVDVGSSSIGVRVQTNVQTPPIHLECTDAYGNSFQAKLNHGYASFKGLESGTQYTISAVITENTGPHRLRGTQSISVTTMPSTELLVMTASAGSEEGTVVIDIVVKDGDPEPASWTVSYCCEGQTSEERVFSGKDRSFTIKRLEVEKEYTFTLVSSELDNLTGVTSTVFTPAKEVTVEHFSMDSYIDGTLTAKWDCTSEPPEIWTVTCVDPEGNTQTVQTNECEASFDGLKLETAYTVKLSAEGLFVPLSFETPEKLTHIDKLNITQAEDGVHVGWTSSGTPTENGWVLVCMAGPNQQTTVAKNVEGNSTVLTELLPGTAYIIRLRSGADNVVVGHCLQDFTLSKPEHFNSRGISESNAKISTFAVPEKEDWKIKDLQTGQTTFTASDKFAYKLTAPTGRYRGSFSLLYVIRNEKGVPVDYGKAQYVWNEVWSWDNGANYGMAGTATAPAENGTYTIELYFSYDLEGYIQYKFVSVSEPFTVTGAEE